MSPDHEKPATNSPSSHSWTEELSLTTAAKCHWLSVTDSAGAKRNTWPPLLTVKSKARPLSMYILYPHFWLLSLSEKRTIFLVVSVLNQTSAVNSVSSKVAVVSMLVKLPSNSTELESVALGLPSFHIAAGLIIPV